VSVAFIVRIMPTRRIPALTGRQHVLHRTAAVIRRRDVYHWSRDSLTTESYCFVHKT